MAYRINIGKFSQEKYSFHEVRNFFLDDYEILKYDDRGKLMDAISCWATSCGHLLNELFKFVKKDKSDILKYILTDDVLKIMFNYVVCELIDYWFEGHDYKEKKKNDSMYENDHGRECISIINNVYYPRYLVLLNEVLDRDIKPFDFESVYIVEYLVCELLEIPLPDRCLSYLPKSTGLRKARINTNQGKR